MDATLKRKAKGRCPVSLAPRHSSLSPGSRGTTAIRLADGVTVQGYWPGSQVLARDAGGTWSSCGNRVGFRSESGPGASCRLPLAAGHLPFVGRLLRSGVRSYLQLNTKGWVLFSGGRSFFWSGEGNAVSLGRVPHGHGPLRQGCCQDLSGTCYYGEYWGNPNRAETNVMAWRRGWPSWRTFYRFAPGSVRHVHAVQFDPFSKRIWVCTGDRDGESRIGYFEPGTGVRESGTGTRIPNPESRIPTLRIIHSNSQSARAVSLLFARDHVYWGTDAGRDTDEKCNWIYRWSRIRGNVERVTPIGAPAYYSTVDNLGRLFVSTAVEGSPSERDRSARIWMSADGERWREIAAWEKDGYPSRFGYGVLSFPQNAACNGRLYVVGHGVRGGPATWLLEVN